MDEITGGAGAGSAVLDQGSGAGDAGAGGAGGGAGAGDQGAGEAGAGAGEGAGAEGGAGAGEGGEAGGGEELSDIEADLEAQGVETDGRRIDDRTRKAIADFKKVNPEGAKRVSETYFRMGSVMKDVGAATPSEAVNKVRQMVATLESLGGEEGITEMQGEVQDYRTELEQFANGDKNLLIQIQSENPEAYATMVGHGLDVLAEKSPDLMDKALLPPLVARLEQAGMYDSMTSLLALIKDGKGQEAYDLGQKIARWLNQAKSMADRNVQMRQQKDPEREANERRAMELDQREKAQFETAITTDVNRINNSATAKVVDPFFKDLKLANEGRREFVNALNSRIWSAMKKDNAFQRAAKGIMAKGDQERASRFISAKFAELLPTHFRSLRDAMYPNYARGGTRNSAAAGRKNGAAAGAGGAARNGAAAAATYKGGKPDRDLVDWERTNETLWITGRAYLKGKPDMIRFNWKDIQ